MEWTPPHQKVWMLPLLQVSSFITISCAAVLLWILIDWHLYSAESSKEEDDQRERWFRRRINTIHSNLGVNAPRPRSSSWLQASIHKKSVLLTINPSCSHQGNIIVVFSLEKVAEDKEKLKQCKRSVKEAFAEFYRGLCLLEAFAKVRAREKRHHSAKQYWQLIGTMRTT